MARHRWDIEEHMLVEKPLGYEYRPLDSRDWNAMQGFHHLMPMAHLLHILVLHQTKLWPMVFFLSIRGTMITLVEAARDFGVDKARIARLGERRHKPGWCGRASTPNSRVQGIEKTTVSPGE